MQQQPTPQTPLMFTPGHSGPASFPLPSSAYKLTDLHGKDAEPSDPGSSSPQSTGSRSPHSPGSLSDKRASISQVPHSTSTAMSLKVEDSVDDMLPPNGTFGRPRVSLALLLEASAAAAAAERKAEQRANEAAAVSRASSTAETDRFITEAIHRVQTMPRNQRKVELKPVDRRELDVRAKDPNWSRLGQIERDPRLLGECRRLVRGTQGCGRECDSKFTNLVEFAKHVDAMHDLNFRPFLCPKDRCPWAIIGFHERSECTRHIRTKHHKAMYSCDINGCNKIYNRSDAFRRHVRQAHANPESRFNRLSKCAPLSNDDADDESSHGLDPLEDQK